MEGNKRAIRRIHADRVYRHFMRAAKRLVSLSVDGWQQRMNDPVFVAFWDDEPVVMTGLLRQRTSKMAHQATIIMVYVRKNLRGTGFARNLLGIVADLLATIGIVQLAWH